jgi:TRADD-N domain-containing protein
MMSDLQSTKENWATYVAKHEQLIMHYYGDVQEQAKRSFDTANSTARMGFFVLIVTLAYAFVIDGLSRFGLGHSTEASFTAAGVGIISGVLIKFIAGVAFWLYSRSAQQFAAFHICLERTHRYLLAYKMVEQLVTNKDETLRDLVCIMANAPMISRDHVDQRSVEQNISHGQGPLLPRPDLGKPPGGASSPIRAGG